MFNNNYHITTLKHLIKRFNVVMRNYIIKDVKKNMCYLHKNNIKFYEQKNLPLNFDEKDGKKIAI